MPMQGLEALACTGIPDTHYLIMATAGEDVATGAKCNGPHPGSVPLQGLEALAGTRIPYLHHRIITATGDGGTIGAKRN